MVCCVSASQLCTIAHCLQEARLDVECKLGPVMHQVHGGAQAGCKDNIDNKDRAMSGRGMQKENAGYACGATPLGVAVQCQHAPHAGIALPLPGRASVIVKACFS